RCTARDPRQQRLPEPPGRTARRPGLWTATGRRMAAPGRTKRRAPGTPQPAQRGTGTGSSPATGPRTATGTGQHRAQPETDRPAPAHAAQGWRGAGVAVDRSACMAFPGPFRLPGFRSALGCRAGSTPMNVIEIVTLGRRMDAPGLLVAVVGVDAQARVDTGAQG